MAPAAQRTIYLRRADAESGDLKGRSQVDNASRGGGGQDIAEAATGVGAGVAGRSGGEVVMLELEDVLDEVCRGI